MEKKTILGICGVIILIIAAWQLFEYFTYKNYERKVLDNAAQMHEEASKAMLESMKNMNF